MSGQLTCEAVARAALGEPNKRERAELLWRCPHPERHQHADRNPSLKVNPKKDVWMCAPCGGKGKARALAAFIAGDNAAVTAWLKDRGLLSAAKGKRKAKADGRGPCVATYEYTDLVGNQVARKLRFEPGTGGRKKDFAWERWENGKWLSGLGEDGNRTHTPLYRLPQIANEQSVIVTEGEKDADAGAHIGLPTTTSGGTGSWREDHSDTLRGEDVVIIADADEPGRLDAQIRAASLHGKAASAKVVEIPDAKDLAEAISTGWTRERLLALFRDAPEWRPATGAEILDSLMRFSRRFVSLTEPQARAETLWVAHTHAMDAADCTPYLSINSAEKQSGKTRLLEVLQLLVPSAWFTGKVTAAVLVRKIHALAPTLLLDESDAAFSGEKEYAEALRGVLNTGYRRGGCASLCVGQGANMTWQDFSTFCPKAIAGIGRLPDTVADRSIPVRLKRARRGDVERFRERDVKGEAGELQAKMAAWAAANIEALKGARPAIPRSLSDRQADVCEPLLGIADLAGGEWPEAARTALVKLCGDAQRADDSIGVKLLADIHSVFYPRENGGNPLPVIERIASEELSKALAEMEGRPWAEWGKTGKPITKNRLARFLSERYSIGPPKTMRLPDERRLNGYDREWFEESWESYLPHDFPVSPDSKRDIVTTRMNTGENGDFQDVTDGACHVSENEVLPNRDLPCHDVTNQKQGKEEKQPQKVPVEWEA
jgi:hypothetical protein